MAVCIGQVRFLHLWTDSSRSINSQKKNEANISTAILTEQTWSIKDLLSGLH